MNVCRFRCLPLKYKKSMDKNSIAKATQQLETKEDPLRLLNQIKQDEMTECGMSDKVLSIHDKTSELLLQPQQFFSSI